MYQSEIYQLLAAPFKAGEIEWRVQTCIEDKMQGLAVPYVQNRAIQNRLDDVLTPAGWKNEYTLWQPNSQLCSIFIRIEYEDGTVEWVGKSDGSSNSDIEPIKGGLSDAMKRAAVHWGIGRYLYDISSKWVTIEKRGKSFTIVKSEQPKLDEYYNNEVKRIVKGLLSTDFIASNQNLEGNQNFSNKDSRLPPYESSVKNDSFKPMTELYSEMDSSDETSRSTHQHLYLMILLFVSLLLKICMETGM